MQKLDDVLTQVASNFPLLTSAFNGAQKIWLTLYISAPIEKLEDVRNNLERANWVNFPSAKEYCGFAYPKKEVENTDAVIVEELTAAFTVCSDYHVDFLHVDADTSPNVEQSHFTPLFSAT